ncbi:MAG TPA: hypothetical protein VK524_01110 [Polyangiaceae bacterium]|nr:hypothetical protein [Polyangiaceae bacterium]
MLNGKGALLWCLLASFTAGCGSSKPRSGTPDQRTGESGSSGEVALPELTPVSAPPELIGVGRVRNPGEFLDSLAQWSKAPLDWRSALAKEEPGIERVLKLDSPIDVALVLDKSAGMRPKAPQLAVSIGLSSWDAALEFARHKGEVLRKVQEGVYAVGEPPSRCLLARSLGSAPARFVCGDEPADVEALLPYMTRGMPRETFGNSDVHVELRVDPVRTRHARDLRQLKSLIPVALSHLAIDVPRVDRAMGDALHGLADEVNAVVDDLQRLDLDIVLVRAQGGAELRTSVQFRKQSSWIAQTVFEREPAPPPDLFWALPRESSAASFVYPASPGRYAGLRRTFGELVDGLLEHEKVSRAVRDTVSDVVTESFKTDAAWVRAEGPLPPAAPAKPGSGPEQARERLRQQLGWHVAAVGQKADTLLADFAKLVQLYNSGELRRMLEKRAKVKLQHVPTVQKRAPRVRGLPAGSVAYQITVPAQFFDEEEFGPGMGYKFPRPAASPAKPKPKAVQAKPLPLVFLIVPDGERTWFGVSADEKLLIEKLVKLKTQAETLATRADVSALKAQPAKAGGFFTIASVMSGTPIAGAASTRVANALPHHAETPIPYRVTTTPGSMRSLVWSTSVPRAALEDLGGLIMTLVAGNTGAEPPASEAPAPAAPSR